MQVLQKSWSRYSWPDMESYLLPLNINQQLLGVQLRPARCEPRTGATTEVKSRLLRSRGRERLVTSRAIGEVSEEWYATDQLASFSTFEVAFASQRRLSSVLSPEYPKGFRSCHLDRTWSTALEVESWMEGTLRSDQ